MPLAAQYSDTDPPWLQAQPADRLDRDVALAALAQAEDNLTLLRDLGTLTDQRAAADTARRPIALSHPHYRESAVG